MFSYFIKTILYNYVNYVKFRKRSNGKKDIRSRYAMSEPEAKRKLKELKKTAYSETPEQRKKQTVGQFILDWFPRYKKGLKPAAYDRQKNTIK